MRIGFVYDPFDAKAGSFGAHGHALATELTRRGHELWGPGLPSMPGVVSLPSNRRGKLRMIRRADLLYIRVGVLHWQERCTWLRLLRPTCPVVWEFNGIAEEIFLTDVPRDEAMRRLRLDRRRKRRMAKLVDAAVCVTDALADYARGQYGISRCVVAPNGGDTSAWMPDGGNTVLSTLHDRFKVLWAGSADQPWQGLDLLVEAARACETAAPDVLFVAILGGQRSACVRLPHRPNLLVIPGTDRPTVQRYLADADCVLSLYRECEIPGAPDGVRRHGYMSPLKLLEAMAAGRPVIATAIGAIREIVRDGIDGVLVAPSADQVVDAIVRLRGDAALRGRLGRAARERIESSYTWRHTVDRIERLLLELVARRSPRREARSRRDAAVASETSRRTTVACVGSHPSCEQGGIEAIH